MTWHDQLPNTGLNRLPLWRKYLDVCSVQDPDCAAEQVEKAVTGYSRKLLADKEWCKWYGSWGCAGPWFIVVFNQGAEASPNLYLPWVGNVADDAGEDLFW